MSERPPNPDSSRAGERVLYVLGRATTGLRLDEITAAVGIEVSQVTALLLDLERRGLAGQEQRRWHAEKP